MRFEELNTYTNDVLLKLIESQNLCKYLNYDTDAETDPLTLPNLNLSDRKKLIMKRIFPMPKLPSTQSVEASTYMTVHFDNIARGDSHMWKNSSLKFTILSHTEQWLMPSKLRPYSIMHEIDLIFNNQRVIGIGKTQFNRSRFVFADKDFVGFEVEYSIVDFS